MNYKDPNEIDIKQFKIIEKLGHGLFGSVYKAETKKKNVYAAKVTNIKDDEQIKNIISHKSGILTFVHHPTLIKYLGYSNINFNDEKNVTIIMEFAENGSLNNFLENIKKSKKSSKLNNTKKQIIITGIAKGMKYLHDRNIIHRDLKPGNILLNKNFHPLISDFAFSKLNESDHLNSQFSYQYIAPEILNQQKYDNKVDVYSFGILMYEILTGSDSFPKMGIDEFVKKICSENFRPKFDTNQQINEFFQQLMKDCWSNDPKQRPTFDEIFNKLSKSAKYLLNNVDMNEFQRYIEKIDEITNPIEEALINKIKKIEQENHHKNKKIQENLSQIKIVNDEHQKLIQKLRDENDRCNLNIKQMKCKNEEQQKIIFKKFDDEKNKITKEINHIKSLNEQQMRTIKRYEQENQKLLAGNEKYKQDLIQANSKNEQQQRKIKNLEDENKQLKKENEKIKKELAKFKNDTDQKQDIIIANDIKENHFSMITEPKLKNDIKENHFSMISDPKIIVIPVGKPNPKNVRSNIYNNRNFNEKMTICEFNALPLKSQLSVSEKLSKINDIGSFFTNVNNLVAYFNNFNQITNSCLEIKGDDEEQLIKVRNNQCIQITHFAIEAIFECKTIDLSSIAQILNNFDQISFELKYPTETYEMIHNFVLKLWNSTSKKSKLMIGLFITSEIIFDPNFLINTKVCYVNFDESINEIMPLTGCASITQITIPSSLKKIKRNFFSKCTSLSIMKIPFSIKSIGNGAFSNCTSLNKITIPTSVTKIGKYAFSECSSLHKISIPSSVTSIKSYTFNKCSSLTQITIPHSVTKIENNAFFKCLSLKQITIPSSVIEIGDNAFLGCSSLAQISIPFSVSKYGKNIFCGVKIISITGDLKMIKKEMFSNCSSLTQITISSSVIEIENHAFYNCSLLEQITIPSSVRSIGWDAFNGCSSLKEISIPSSVTRIEVCTFEGCSSLVKITIPQSVKSIEKGAFENCTALKEISIPSSVTSIGWNAFHGCSSLKEISIPSSVNKIEVCTFERCTLLTQISIPFSVTEIENHAFYYCTSLSKISIPSSVISIKSGAFAVCSSLSQIKIPSSVTSIGDGVFYACSSLEQISIPSSVTYLGGEVFYKCSSLKEISIPSNLKINLNEFSSSIKINRF